MITPLRQINIRNLKFSHILKVDDNLSYLNFTAKEMKSKRDSKIALCDFALKIIDYQRSIKSNKSDLVFYNPFTKDHIYGDTH